MYWFANHSVANQCLSGPDDIHNWTPGNGTGTGHNWTIDWTSSSWVPNRPHRCLVTKVCIWLQCESHDVRQCTAMYGNAWQPLQYSNESSVCRLLENVLQWHSIRRPSPQWSNSSDFSHRTGRHCNTVYDGVFGWLHTTNQVVIKLIAQSQVGPLSSHALRYY